MEAIKVLSSNKFYTAEMKQNRFCFISAGGGGTVFFYIF